MANFESMPKNGPPLAELLTEEIQAQYPAAAYLSRWGMEYPFIGTFAGRFDGKQAYCWLGNFNQQLEAPGIAAFTEPNPRKETVLANAEFFYGIPRLDEIERAPNPTDPVLDAAIHSNPEDQGKVYALWQVILHLDQMITIEPVTQKS